MRTPSSVSGSLLEKLETIERVEEEHSFFGVRINPKGEHTKTLITEDVVDEVKRILDDTIALSQIKHTLRVVSEYPPS